MVEGPFLLDTSTILWSLADPARLSRKARQAMSTGPRVLSVVSYWEVVIKSRKGLLDVADPISWWKRATALLAGEVLSVRATHISALAGLPDLHKDPFDRMLIAQAVAEGLALVTNDGTVGRYAVKTVW